MNKLLPNKLLLVCLLSALALLMPLDVLAKKISLQEFKRLKQVESILLENISLMESELEPSATFTKYKKEYLNSIPKTSPKLVSNSVLTNLLSKASFIFLGDEHTTLRSQQNTCKLLKLMKQGKRPITLVLEWVDISFQNEIDLYLAGKMSLTNLKKKINYQKLWGFQWKGYANIIKTAKLLKTKVLLVERLKKKHSLLVRDSFIVKKISENYKSNPNMRYLIVYGDYHIFGPNHLSEKAMKAGLYPQIIFLGDAPNAYWSILKQTMDPAKIGIAQMKKGVFYIPNGTPLERSFSYQNYLADLLGYDETDFEYWVDKSQITPQQSRHSRFDSLHRINSN